MAKRNDQGKNRVSVKRTFCRTECSATPLKLEWDILARPPSRPFCERRIFCASFLPYRFSPFITLFPFLVGGCRQLAHRPFDGHFWMSFIRRPIHHFAITLVLRAHDLLGPLVSHFLARLCVRSADMSWLRRGLHIWKRGQLKRGGEL